VCDNISIDFAVMEKADNVSGIPAADFGWNDVGSWNAVYELQSRDGAGNAIGRESICLDAHNNFVDVRGKLVALGGRARSHCGGYAGCAANYRSRARPASGRRGERIRKAEAQGSAVKVDYGQFAQHLGFCAGGAMPPREGLKTPPAGAPTPSAGGKRGSGERPAKLITFRRSVTLAMSP